jgi:hypothetical protein
MTGQSAYNDTTSTWYSSYFGSDPLFIELIGASSTDWSQQSRFYLKMETVSEMLCFKT